jgi:hypothetical protein
MTNYRLCFLTTAGFWGEKKTSAKAEKKNNHQSFSSIILSKTALIGCSFQTNHS